MMQTFGTFRPDRDLQPTLDYTATAVGADLAFTSRWTGLGIGIAVIDSGIDITHPDFAAAKGPGRVAYSESFSTGKSAMDKYGHGTHVAAIAAGSGTASTGGTYTHTFRGVAPDAHIVYLRVLDGNGKGRDSSVIAAIERAIALKNQFNIRVINLSLGHPVYETYKLDPLAWPWSGRGWRASWWWSQPVTRAVTMCSAQKVTARSTRPGITRSSSRWER
jgi:subtilisin family serine protease